MNNPGEIHAIKVCDADPDRRHRISSYLASHGLQIFEAETGAALLHELSNETSDLLLVQLPLPDLDKFTLLNEIRLLKHIRCILLDDSSEMVDRVLALELGADDYLSRSLELRELLARVRAVLRPPPAPINLRPLSVKDELSAAEAATTDLRFERVQRRLAMPDGSKVPLTTAEFNLLRSLADNTNVTLTRETLYGLVYNRRWSVYDRTLDTLIAKVRKKIEIDPRHPEMIKTVHGSGYVFTGIACC